MEGTQQKNGGYFLLALLVGAGVLAYFLFRPFLAPLILALVFAVVSRPLYVQITQLIPGLKGIAALFTVLLGTVVFLLPIAFVGSLVVSQATGLYTNLSAGEVRANFTAAIQNGETVVVRYIPAAQGYAEKISANLSSYVQQALEWMIQNLGAATSGLASFFLSIIIFFIAYYYFLHDGDVFKQAVIELSPLRDVYDQHIFAQLERAINSIVRGSFFVGLIQGVATGFGFWIFGVPNFILWGAVAALAAMVPMIGTSVVFIPTVIYLLLVGNTFSAVGLAVWGAVGVGLIDNFLAPRLIGKGASLHPLAMLIALLGGLAFFGPVGIFLGPLALSLLFTLFSIYAEMSKQRAS